MSDDDDRPLQRDEQQASEQRKRIVRKAIGMRAWKERRREACQEQEQASTEAEERQRYERAVQRKNNAIREKMEIESLLKILVRETKVYEKQKEKLLAQLEIIMEKEAKEEAEEERKKSAPINFCIAPAAVARQNPSTSMSSGPLKRSHSPLSQQTAPVYDPKVACTSTAYYRPENVKAPPEPPHNHSSPGSSYHHAPMSTPANGHGPQPISQWLNPPPQGPMNPAPYLQALVPPLYWLNSAPHVVNSTALGPYPPAAHWLNPPAQWLIPAAPQAPMPPPPPLRAKPAKKKRRAQNRSTRVGDIVEELIMLELI